LEWREKISEGRERISGDILISKGISGNENALFCFVLLMFGGQVVCLTELFYMIKPEDAIKMVQFEKSDSAQSPCEDYL
jgi:hypothetical protein